MSGYVSEARPRGPQTDSPAGVGRSGRTTFASTHDEEIGRAFRRITIVDIALAYARASDT